MATITYDSELMYNAVLGASGQTTEIASYTITISALDSTGFPLSSGSVVIGASPASSAVVNGVTTTLSSPGDWHTLDASGSTTIIVQAESITSANFWVTGVKDAKKASLAINPVTGVILNPSHKVISALSSINEHTNLSQLRGQSGKPLFHSGNQPSKESIQQATQVFQNCGQMLQNVHVDVGVAALMPTREASQQAVSSAVARMEAIVAAQKKQASPAAHVEGASNTHVRAAAAPHIQAKFSFGGIFGTIGHGIEDGGRTIGHGIEDGGRTVGHGIENGGRTVGHGIEDGGRTVVGGLTDFGNDVTHAGEFIGKGFSTALKDVKEFGVQKAGDVWKFVYKVANETKHFVIKTVQDLSSVLDFVWGQLKLGLQELIDFAGFLFEWDDIKNTSNYIKGMLNATLNHGINEIGLLENKINTFFQDTKAKIKGRLEKHASSPGISTGQVSTASTQSQSQGLGPSVAKSPALNFLNERYQNSGMQSSSMNESPSGSNINGASQFHSSIMPFKRTMENDLKSIGKDLSNLFHTTRSLKTADIWEALANDSLDAILDVLNGIIQAILKGLVDLIRDFERVGNAGIHIPILSDLLRLKGLGDLSAFDLVCTLLGFMVCVFYKLIKHQRIPLPSQDPNTVVPQLFNGSVMAVDKQTITVIETIGEFTTTLGLRIYNSVTMAKALAEQGPQGGATKMQPSTMSGPVSIKSLPTMVKIAMKVLSSTASLRCDKSQPGYEFTHAASCVSFVNTIATAIYTFTATGLPEEVQAIEELYFMTALINFALYDGAAAEMAVAAAESKNSADKEKYAIAAEQCANENVCNTVASCGQYVGMVTAMGVDESVEAGPEVELAEAVAVAGFAVYMGANDALLVSKAVNVVTSIMTEAEDVRGVAPNP